MKKAQLSYLLRILGFIYYTDWIWFYIQRFKNQSINQDFKKKHPDIHLPPDYLIYESFQINYHKYYTESIDTANWLINYFKKYSQLKDKRILDWGCGPGRIIRHLPSLIGDNCKFYGTDYNKQSIEWCSKHLKDIDFNNNLLEAQLPYTDSFFDIIYGISIFTHLSEQQTYGWYAELYRVLKPGGIMLLTTQGDNYKIKLTESELKQFNKGGLVERGNTKEGHRTYSAFHPQEFMIKLFDNAEVLEHIVVKPEKGKWLPQDVWIIRKK